MIKYICNWNQNINQYGFYIDDKKIGGFTVTFHKDHKEICAVHIKEEFRGLGYGTQMMRELVSYFGPQRVDFGRSKNNLTLKLKCLVHNDAAVKCYQKSGFEIIEYNNNMPHDTYATYIMQKTF